MDERAPEEEPAARIRAVAARQHGIVTRTQMIACGLSPAAVGRRLDAGELRALHRGVYLLGPLESVRSRDAAAALAGGPDALLSYTSAARLWEVLHAPDPPGPTHVTAPAAAAAADLESSSIESGSWWPMSARSWTASRSHHRAVP